MKNPLPHHLLEIESEGLGGPPHWSLRDYESELSSPFSRLYRTEGEGEGFVLFRQTYADVEIMNLAVRLKGRGWGKHLMLSFLDFLRSSQSEGALARRVFLEVARSNGAAIALYESLGFRHLGVRPRYYRNGDDALTYEKTLDQG